MKKSYCIDLFPLFLSGNSKHPPTGFSGVNGNMLTLESVVTGSSLTEEGGLFRVRAKRRVLSMG